MSRQYTPLLSLSAVANGDVSPHRAVGFDGAQATVVGQKVKGIAQYGAADGEAFAIVTHGTSIAETGGPFSAGDSLIVDAQGRVVKTTGPLKIAAGATPVTSSAATGPLAGADLPEYVVADALEDSGGAGKFVEILLRR
jgi:hypothetical protein